MITSCLAMQVTRCLKCRHPLSGLWVLGSALSIDFNKKVKQGVGAAQTFLQCESKSWTET